MKKLFLKILNRAKYICKKYIEYSICYFKPFPKTSITIVFHLNQESTPYLAAASKFSYVPAIKYLLLETDLNICLHISGPCLEYFEAKEPELLELLKKNVAEKRIELLASAYSQPVIYCIDDYSAHIQIEAHLKKIENIFNVRPEGFWIPERVVDPRTIDIIKQHGFKYTIVEDRVFNMKHNFHFRGKLDYFSENKHFSHIFNYFIADAYSIHEIKSFFCLYHKTDHLVIAEDLECIGLWHIEKGMTHTIGIDKLAEFCDFISSTSQFNVVLPSEILKNKDAVKIDDSSIKSAALWMEDSFKGNIFHFHENGEYKNWWDFADNSEKICEYKNIFENIAGLIASAKNKMDPLFLSEIEKIFAAHQYELGCVGIDGKNRKMWDTALHCRFLVQCACLHYEKKYGVHSEENVLLCVYAEYICIFNVYGDIIYWYCFKNNAFICPHFYHRPLEDMHENNSELKSMSTLKEFENYYGIDEKKLFPWLTVHEKIFSYPVFMASEMFFDNNGHNCCFEIEKDSVSFKYNDHIKKYCFSDSIYVEYKAVSSDILTFLPVDHKFNDIIYIDINKDKNNYVKKIGFYVILYCIEIKKDSCFRISTKRRAQ